MKKIMATICIMIMIGCAGTISEVILPVGSITSLKDITGRHYKIISIDTIGVSRDLMKIKYRLQGEK